jgi:tetratricopeptide (TPR) repeat protein
MKIRRPKNQKKTNIFIATAIARLEREIHEAWVERDMDKSIRLLHEVLKLNPRNVDTLLLIGRAHGMQFRYDEAIEFFEQAVENASKGDHVAVLLKAANMARNFFNSTIAESLFEEAIARGNSTSAKLALADYSLQIRKRGVGQTLIDEVLTSSPENPLAVLLWCRIHESRIEACVDNLKKLVGTQTAELKAKAAYQLAKMLDLAGDFDGAMQALAIAKSVLMPARDMFIRSRANIRAKQMELAQAFTNAKRSEWGASSDQLGASRRLALLSGHPRSGTTLLEQVLDSHPNIISAEETDNFYTFALSPLMRNHLSRDEILKVMDEVSSDELVKARESYFRSMDQCLGESVSSRLLIDKNPSLTALVPAIFRIVPETKFVTMIRDPRDVVLSCYMQSFVPVSSISGNYLTLQDTAIEYAAVMDVWKEFVKHIGGNACEVHYEEMVEDLEGNARRVLDFLGIEWSDSVMGYYRHAQEKVVRSPTANAVTEKVHTRAKNRWKNYARHLEPVMETLTPYLKGFGYE